MNQSIHQRRTLLSLHRRSGSQLPPEVMDGRVQRHAQSWRDLCDEYEKDDWFSTARGAVHGLMLGIAVWVLIVAGVLLAVRVLG